MNRLAFTVLMDLLVLLLLSVAVLTNSLLIAIPALLIIYLSVAAAIFIIFRSPPITWVTPYFYSLAYDFVLILTLIAGDFLITAALFIIVPITTLYARLYTQQETI